MGKASVFIISPTSPPPPQHLVQNSYLAHNHTWWIVAAVLLVLPILGLLCFCIMRKTIIKNNPSPNDQQPGDHLDEDELILRRFKLEEVEKATNNFSKDCLVGTGGFGDVYVGDFPGEGTLAIKKLHAESYMNKEEFRNGRNGKSLNWRERVKVAIGAAKGIAHLHEGLKPSIIHRDVKPSNILIDEYFEAKVSDFGLVKLGPVEDQSHVSTQIKGTPGYLDPAYCSSCHLTPFTDVYSFGIILLQLITEARPCLEKGNVLEILDARLLLEPCNLEVMLKMGQLGLKCVVRVPKQRPTMTQVWQELEEALNSADCIGITSHDQDRCSQSFVSIDGIKLQRFHVDMDGFSMNTASLKSFELASVVFSDDGDHNLSTTHKSVNLSSV